MFGVGGGSVIVPLLILWFAYGEREATGTSLAAIVVIALLATIAQGAYGNVDLLEGAARRAARGRRGDRRDGAAAAGSRAGDLAAVRRACWSSSRSSCWSADGVRARGTARVRRRRASAGCSASAAASSSCRRWRSSSTSRRSAPRRPRCWRSSRSALVGAWRQHRLRQRPLRDGLLIGALSPLGVLAGVVLANAVSERVLEVSFALLLLVVAAQLRASRRRSGRVGSRAPARP